MSEVFICPLPQIWNEIHQNLTVALENNFSESIPKPPIPLILNGWTFSSDQDKSSRWKETLNWAEKYGFIDLIPKFSKTESYFGNPSDTYNYGDDLVSELFED